MQPAPVHVNQIDAAGRFPDGSSSARFDCTVAVAVMMADAATAGAVRPTTTALRGAQRDQQGGIGLDDVAEALQRLAGLTVSHGRKSWSTLLARWQNGNGAGLQGSYAVVGAYSSQPSFRGGHAIYVQRLSRPGWLVVNDPLARSSREWPVSVVRRFYLSGLALAGWVVNGSSSSSVVADAGGTVLSVVNASSASSCSQVTILTPSSPGIGLYPIPRDSIGQPCVECAAGFVPAIVSVGPIQTLQGFVSPQDVPGKANACVRAGTKEGDRPASDPGQIAGDVLGAWVGPLIGGLGDVGRNLILLVFALATLLIGLYVLATANDEGG